MRPVSEIRPQSTKAISCLQLNFTRAPFHDQHASPKHSTPTFAPCCVTNSVSLILSHIDCSMRNSVRR